MQFRFAKQQIMAGQARRRALYDPVTRQPLEAFRLVRSLGDLQRERRDLAQSQRFRSF